MITAVIADSRYQWYYWIAPILMIGVLGFVLALGGGYLKKVFFPKHRGRKVEE